MDKRIYISVILPLRLEWEPCYWTDIEDIGPGQRVRVLFAGREYTGTVSAAGIEPQLAPSKIQQVISREDNMAGILPEEIRLWRILAGYYMCTVGEVYKTAYPGHNLVRTHAQYKLLQSIESQYDAMKKIVDKYAR